MDQAPARTPPAAGPQLVGRRLTLCVSGSIAAYKAAALARLLTREGAQVQPVMTRSAQEFLGRATLAGLTGRPVQHDLFGAAGEPHVELARWSELMVIAPATADLLARLSQARADDLVTATALCARCPIIAAPAMHPAMWGHPLTQANLERLQSIPGWEFVGPVIGEVASGETGLGRMAEPEEIAAAVVRRLRDSSPEPGGSLELAGQRVVVTAGPTVEDLDPVRALTNRSSGKMGFAIAESAARRGARVSLIAGPVALATPPGLERVDVRSALEMQAALSRALGDAQAPVAALVMCAAVADYRPRQVSPAKMKRSTGNLTIELVPNPDLLAEIGAARTGARPFLLGFAVETETGQRLVAAGRAKLAQKRVDAIVANAAADALGTDETRAVLVTRDGEQVLGPGSKASVADQITAFLASRLH
ncbi:MAG TPA: bifunctional phosphopantothenoylcysteine decarboxylase/phosphopantothenate--cysteine ligase CoaBC [Polyangiaceae bacterium]|nr:bifunctional phosphopantothenoylcysteine decarboxylase/phosphopantothenate--cysteine ligase CoaBC [Polyangiaceae bacterium]